MKSSRRLHDELQFVSEFSTLFDVLQQAATSQLRRTQEQASRHPRLTEILGREYLPLLPSASQHHRLVRGGRAGRLLVLIASEEGFVGPLYTALAREARAKADETTQWLLVGRRGLRLLGSRAAQAKVIPLPPEELADEQMRRVGQFVMASYRQADLRDAWLVAPRFVSATHQEVAATQLLPIPAGASRGHAVSRELIIEPSLDRVLEQLALLWTEAVCVEAFWSARCAEFAARALHVEVSRQELSKRARVLHHEFFKALHERVDLLVRETCVVQRYAAKHLQASARSSGAPLVRAPSP